MWREIPLVLGKDLRIEVRSRVLVNQVAPFTLLVIVLFGFALDADTTTLRSFSAGLFWVAVLLSALLAIQRAFAIESADGAKTWVEIEEAGPSTFGFAVAVHPKAPDTAYFVPAISDAQRVPLDGRLVALLELRPQ